MFWTLSSDLLQVLVFFTWALIMLYYMAMDVAPPYQIALEGSAQGASALAFLGGMGPLFWTGSQKWSCEELVYEQSPAPSTHRVGL
jgi:hypothetical protein